MDDLFAAECGGDNPLMQVVGQLARKDQAYSGPPPGAYGDPRARPGAPAVAGPLHSQSGGDFFRDDGALALDMQRLQLDQQRRRGMPGRDSSSMAVGGHSRANDWASDFATSATQSSLAGPAPIAPSEFAAFDRAFSMAHNNTATGWADAFDPRATVGPIGPGMAGPISASEQKAMEESWVQAQSDPHNWASEFLQYDEATAATEKGLSAEQRELQSTADELVKQANDPKFKDSKFMNFVKKIGAGEVVLEGNQLVENPNSLASDAKAADWANEFANQETANGTNLNPSAAAANWANTFSEKYASNEWAQQFAENPEMLEQYFEGDGQLPDEFDEMERSWNEVHANHDTPKWEASSESGYSFNPENPFLSESVTYEQALENARQALHGGALAAAILWCEAAVQKEPERIEGWEQLGLNQAENEQETPAILALRQSIKLDPSRSSAHLALSASYTNELRFSDAYNSLETALRSNPKYANIVPEVTIEPSPRARYLPLADRHAKVQSMYINAAQQNPDSVDADVQVGLGILFNISNEYDKAVDCFEAALQSRPDDSALWNKLGASLANGNRSEEAVAAYHSALQLRPGYIRARYNLGISCINLKSYRDASEHFLAALKLQQLASDDSTRRNMSDTIWNSLRMSLLMGNEDTLANLTRDRNLEVFKGHFDF